MARLLLRRPGMLLLALAQAALAAEPVHLTVDEALARLDRQNPTLQRASADARAAQAGVLVAAAPTLPSLTATGGWVHNNEEVVLDLSALFDALSAVTGQEIEGVAPTVLQPLDAVSGTLSVRVPLLVPSTWAGVGQARRVAESADANADAVAATLRGAAVQAIWGEAAAEERVAVQEASVGRARELVGTVGRAVDAGASARLALLQAQTELARREGELLTARAGLDKARSALGTLLGEPGPVVVDAPAPPAGAAGVDVDPLVTGALAHRAEVRAAQAQLDAARASLAAVRLGALPTVGASASGFASTEPYTTGEKTGWRAGVDLTWALVQGGLREGNEGRAAAQVAAAEAGLASARLTVGQQVRDAAADLVAARARVEVTAQQRAFADEAAAVAQRSYREGVVGIDTVLDALEKADLARLAEVDARARLGMADAALRTASGEW